MTQADDERAARRYWTIVAVRWTGIAAFLAGLAILAGAIGESADTGRALVAAGALGTFLFPALLARRWSSKRPR